MLAVLALMALASGQAAGDERDGTQAIDRLAACRGIASDSTRLACFDAAAKAIGEARTRQDIVVLDRAEIRKAKRSLFGFSLPSIKLFGGGKDDEQLKQLVGAIGAYTTLPGGLVRFGLDDGGVWETVEQTMVPLRRGDVVTIKAGSLGSYIATAPGRRAVRVRRAR